jgi:hypothetical protein
MSRELYIYASNDNRVPRSDLDEALAVVGWRCLVFRDLDRFERLEGPDIQSCWILGWEDRDDLTDAITGLISKRDASKLQALFEQDEIGVVTVDLTEDYTPDPEVTRDLREAGVDETHIAFMEQAKLFYSVRTSASRNDASLLLQDMVWTALGVAAYGLLEDPQEGTFELVSKEELEAEE